MAIEIAGAVYCPLSPGDPQQRLYALLKQTQSRIVLIHALTREDFQNDIITLDLDIALSIDHKIDDLHLYRLSKIAITPENIAFTIFTSGSTGAPKAVSIHCYCSNVRLCYHRLRRLNCDIEILLHLFVLSFIKVFLLRRM
jgi:N-(5-amino-5-carboxypentanoyl)-L-cysteinyl-D-valine synthase